MFRETDKCLLKDIANITMGQSPDSNSYNYSNDGLPFYQGKTDFSEKYVVPNVYCMNPLKKAKKGDVLLSVRAPVGSVNITQSDCCIGRGLAAIHNKNKSDDNEYLFYLLQSVNTEFLSIEKGGTFKSINKDDIYNLQVPNPDETSKKVFVDFVNQTDKLKFEYYKLSSTIRNITEQLR